MSAVSSRKREPDLPVHAVVRGKIAREPETVITELLGVTRYRPPEGHRVFFKGAQIEGVDFSRTTWNSFLQVGCTFTDCDFRAARFRYAEFGTMPKPTLFKRCSFVTSDLLQSHLINARFEECDFSGARIEEWTSSIAEFVECRFEGTLERCIFWGRPHGPLGDALRPKRVRNEFRGNDFSHADLRDCSFRGGIDIREQRWPTSSEYVRLTHFRERIAAAVRAVAAWAPGPERREAEVMLTVLAIDAEPEQEEGFLRRDDMPITPQTRDRVWQLLESEPLGAAPAKVKRKKRHLVLYDYGQGGVWAYLTSDSRRQITEGYPQLHIYDKPPEFLLEADLIRIAATMTVDIADHEHPFLRALRRRGT
jgi:uncharacterized protein YjbI with pentapeptide repeats